MANKFLYFAYGSNMLSRRLQARCPSARFIAPAHLENHSLAFSKLSKDGSGKATPIDDQNAFLHGAAFEVGASDLPNLDRAEGYPKGYDRHEVSINVRGTSQAAITYRAVRTDLTLSPYGWYRALVLAGAIEHNLPHQDMIRSVDYDFDKDDLRRAAAVEILEAAGYVYDDLT